MIVTLVAAGAFAWEYIALPLQVPAAVDAPTVIVGTVKSWKPDINPNNLPVGENLPYQWCNTNYVFAVDEVVRGSAVVGGEITVRWGGCKLEDGSIRRGVSGIPTPPPVGARFLVFLSPSGSLFSEGVFWADDSGAVYRISDCDYDARGRPLPSGDPIVAIDDLLAVMPGAETTVVDREAVYAPYARAVPVRLDDFTAAIRSRRLDSPLGAK